MASVDDLETFIKTTIPGTITSYTVVADDITIGQDWQNMERPNEVLLRHVTSSDVQRDQGRGRHMFEVTLRRKHFDKMRHEDSAKELRTAASELEDKWDTALFLFQTGAPAVLISRVRSYRPEETLVMVRGSDIRQRVMIEIDELE